MSDIKVDSQSKFKDDSSSKKVAGPIPYTAWLIMGAEMCERFAYYGASLMFVPFILKVLKLEPSSATAISRAFTFVGYFTTVIGAVISDTYLGKFKTIALFSVVYIVGLALLAVSALPSLVETPVSVPLFCVAIFMFVAWGTGGIKSNVSAFAAEQVPEDDADDVSSTNSNYDYNMTVERVFRYFYWAINIGSFVGQLVCPIIARQGGSYSLSFAVPIFVFLVGLAMFVSGKNRYRKRAIDGNPLLKVFKCISFAVKSRGSNPNSLHWLDNAKLDAVRNRSIDLDVPNNLEASVEWSDSYVDGLKETLKACKIFLFFIFYWALYYNMFDNFIITGVNMKKPEWLGAEQLNLVTSVVILIAIPILDNLVFPFLNKVGLKMTPIRRITIGFTLLTLGFIYATVLQHVVYKTGPYYDFTNVPKGVSDDDRFNDISVFYQIPVYALVALSEIFASATGLEVAFKMASAELKSVVIALYLLSNCGGALIGLALAPVSMDPNFTILFGSQTCVMGVLTVIFYFMFRKLD